MSSSSPSPTAVAAATSSAVTKTLSAGSNLKIVGIILAIASGLLIGSSFVFKKKGLLRSQASVGEGVAYLKSPLWWTGMSMMILGELCNFAAYAFVEAIVVTPLGALSVVICAILSSFFLNEKLSFFGWLGCALCILGSVIIALNGPQEQTVGQIKEFQKLFLAPGFLSFISVLIVAAAVIVFYFAPKYGKNSMLWYIMVCSMIGGISVSVTTGLGAAIVQTVLGDNQFKHWFMYFLFGFVIITLLVEVYYLNVALALFNTAMVTPTYYVIFTFFSMVTTIVLFQGLKSSPKEIITLVMGFLVICLGITILQMSKVDPSTLSKLDRRSTILLQAARQQTESVDEKGILGFEDPGMDTLRGSFGAVGSIIRARTMRRMSQSSGPGHNLRMRPAGAAAPYDATASWLSHSGIAGGGTGSSHGGYNHQHTSSGGVESFAGMKRHQLYDAPVPRDDTSSVRALSMHKPTIKFDSQEIVHSYSRPGQPQSPATHEHRQAIHGSMIVHDGYPPLPPLPGSSAGSIRDSTVPSVGPTEANLLEMEMDSPDLSRSSGSESSTIQQQQQQPLLSGRRSQSDQLVAFPPFLKDQGMVHSAPPMMYRGFNRSPPLAQVVDQRQPQRKDSRDIFDLGGSVGSSLTADSAGSGKGTALGTRTTLLSFPSVTDSAPSQWGDERSAPGDSDGGLRGRANEKYKEKERERTRTPKKYPKGLDDDDLEESQRLWQRATTLDSDDGLSVPSDHAGGAGSIRLVQSGQPKNQI